MDTLIQQRFPIAYWGSIDYFRQLTVAKKVCFDIHEHYIKQTHRNRAYILGPNKVLPLSVPVIKVNGNKTAMKHICIAYHDKWAKEHLKALETAYSSSPYFEHYLYEIIPLYEKKWERLIDFNIEIIQHVQKWLDLPFVFHFSESFDLLQGEIDHRNTEEIPQKKSNYSYHQTFGKNNEFIGNLSVLDAVFNLGPMARKLIV